MTPDATHKDRDLQAAGFMLLAVTLYAFIPLAVEYTKGSANPFLFNMGWRAGTAAGFAAFMAVRNHRLFLSARTWNLTLRAALDWRMLAVAGAYLDVGIFAMSVRFINVSAATIAVETSTLFLVVIMWASYRTAPDPSQRRRLSPTVIPMMLLSLAGLALVVQSQAGEMPGPHTPTNWAPIAGATLALTSALVGALNGFSFRWGTDLSTVLREQRPSSPGETPGTTNTDLYCVIAAALLANTLTVPANLALGLAARETLSPGTLALTVLGGATTFPLAGLASRKANLITRNLGINTIGYLRPVFRLMLLAPFSYVDVENISQLLIGAAAITAANLVVHLDARRTTPPDRS